MDYALLFPNRFLKSAEFLGKDVTVTITGIKTEELEGDKGAKMKGILSLKGTKKEWVLNRTNAECLKAMFGRETNNWINKRVTLYPAPYTDSFTGEVSTAIRVRGSPDIAQTMSIEVHLPRKKPIRMTMQKTGQAAQQQAKTPARQQPAVAAPVQAQAPKPPPEPDPHADSEPPMPDSPPPESLEEAAPF